MRSLADLCRVVAMELKAPLGARRIVALEAYLAMPQEALDHVLAVPITRRDLIRRRLYALKEEA